MTGFGRGEASAEGRTWIAEIRTVNHRFLDQRVVLPRAFSVFEETVKKRVAAALDRGRVELTFMVQGGGAIGPRLAVNEPVARQYHRCLQQLIDDLGLATAINLSDMLTLRDVITQEEQGPDMDKEGLLIGNALDGALRECDLMREREGLALKSDLLERLELFTDLLRRIQERLPELLLQRQSDLRGRVAKLLDGLDLDPIRLAQEAAIIADRSDITEEVVRLGSHIAQFQVFLSLDEPVGRRLDFLLQEFLREVNTLSSKIAHADIAHLGVEMKNEIEKLREQVQNIE
jgi:uncharacterized protein (TIGR00255 family)